MFINFVSYKHTKRPWQLPSCVPSRPHNSQRRLLSWRYGPVNISWLPNLSSHLPLLGLSGINTVRSRSYWRLLSVDRDISHVLLFQWIRQRDIDRLILSRFVVRRCYSLRWFSHLEIFVLRSCWWGRLYLLVLVSRLRHWLYTCRGSIWLLMWL